MSQRPRRVTGRVTPDPDDDDAQDFADGVEVRFKTIWVDHAPQRLVMRQIRRYMRANLGRYGVPLGGRRLSQFSQAGKSALVERLKKLLADEDIAAGRPVNPYRLVHVTIDKRMTLRMFFIRLLIALKDDFHEEPSDRTLKAVERQAAKKGRSVKRDNITELEDRVARWVKKLGIEAIVVDEVQRLARESDDARDVTEKLQGFVDRGIVPIILIGDETSHKFFQSNKYFAARLGKPLELKQLQDKPADRKLFKDFCVEFDRQLVNNACVRTSPALNADDTLDDLFLFSGGHVGRVARLLEIAATAAAERGAATIERFDLYNAVEEFGIEIGWVDENPFRVDRVRPA